MKFVDIYRLLNVYHIGKSSALPDPQALSTNSMSELNSIMMEASQRTESDELDETASSRNKKRLKNKSEVRDLKITHYYRYRQDYRIRGGGEPPP